MLRLKIIKSKSKKQKQNKKRGAAASSRDENENNGRVLPSSKFSSSQHHDVVVEGVSNTNRSTHNDSKASNTTGLQRLLKNDKKRRINKAYKKKNSYGSGCSGTASTSSSSLTMSPSPSPSDGSISSLSTADTSLHQQQQAAKQLAHKTPLSLVPKSADNLLPPSANSSLSCGNNTSPDSSLDDDNEEIQYLENECIALSLAMSKPKKYSHEWFILETRLNNARVELEAAREDRENLNFNEHSIGVGLPSLEIPGIDQMDEVSIEEIVEKSALDSIGEGSIDNCSIPSMISSPDAQLEDEDTDLLFHTLPNTNTKEAADSTLAWTFLGAILGAPAPSSVTKKRTPAKDRANLWGENDEEDEVTNMLFLDNVLKGSGDESPSKLVSEVRGGGGEQDNNCNDIIRNCDQSSNFDQSGSRTTTSSGPHLRLEYDRIESELSKVLKFSPVWFQLKEELVELNIALDDEAEEDDKPSEIQIVQTKSSGSSLGGYEEEGEKKKKGERVGRQQRKKHNTKGLNHFSPPSSSHSSSQKGHQRFRTPTLSPIRSCLSQISPLTARGSPNGHLSPYSVTSKSQGHHSRGASMELYCYSYKDDDDDDDDNDDDQQDIGRLRAEHAQAVERLEQLPQFTIEWFELKGRIVQIADQIDRFDEVCSSSSGESSRNKSVISASTGWTSVFSDESEEEQSLLSYADNLELCMVAEALRARSDRSTFDELDDDEEVRRLDEELLLMDQRDKKAEIDENSQVRLSAAVKIQTKVRCKQQHRQYMNVRDQFTIIQAVYRGKQQRRQYIEAREQSIVIQAIVRGRQHRLKYARARNQFIRLQSIQRGKVDRRGYTVVREKIIAIQAIVRGKQRRLIYASQCQSIKVIQLFLIAKHRRNVYYRIVSSIIFIQCAWRKSLCAKRKKSEAIRKAETRAALAIASKNPKRKEHDSLFDQLEALISGVDSVEEKQYYHACIIQKQWRLYWSCKPVQSLKRRAVHQGCSRFSLFAVIVLQNHWRMRTARRKFTSIRAKVVQIETIVRMKSQYSFYHRQRHMAIVIQSSMRKYWIRCPVAKLLHECEHVSKHLSALVSAVKIQRAWRTRQRHIKEWESVIVIQTQVTEWLDHSGFYDRLLKAKQDRAIELAILLIDCERMKLQLEMIKSSTIIQSYARKWLVQRAAKTNSATIMQSYARRWLIQRKIKSLTLIQSCVRRWLIQRKHLNATNKTTPSLTDKLQEKILSLSMEISLMQDDTSDFEDAKERLKFLQDELRLRREMEEKLCNDDDPQDEGKCLVSQTTSITEEEVVSETNHQMPAPDVPQEEISSKTTADALAPDTPDNEVCIQEEKEVEPPKDCQEEDEDDDAASPEEIIVSLVQELQAKAYEMKTIPAYSPEWTLARLEIKQLSMELKTLHASLNRQ